MTTTKTILAPTDFSIPARNGVEYAINLAKEFNATLILYHAFIPYDSRFLPPEQNVEENKEIEAHIRMHLTKIKEELLISHKNIPVQIFVDWGPVNPQLVEFCKTHKIDIIVMGTQGASGLKEVMIGSCAADTMTKAPCPVIAVPNKYKYKKPKKITFASNYQKQDIASIKFLLKWNEQLKAKIHILHVEDGIHLPTAKEKLLEQNKRKIEKFCVENALTIEHLESKDISKAILQTTLNDKTDMLVMSPVRREGIWNRLFHKSITKTTTNHSRFPILTIPIK